VRKEEKRKGRKKGYEEERVWVREEGKKHGRGIARFKCPHYYYQNSLFLSPGCVLGDQMSRRFKHIRKIQMYYTCIYV